LGESGDRVEQTEHLLALVAEELGDRQRELCRLSLDQRWLVRRGHHRHRTGETFRAKRILKELVDLLAPLADQPDHDHIDRDVARQHREQARLADARTGEDAEALTTTEWQQRVDALDAGLDSRAEASTRERSRRPPPQGIGLLAGQQSAAARLVQRTAKSVDHTTEPTCAGSRIGARDQAHRCAARDPVRLVVQEEQGRAGMEADDFPGQIASARTRDRARAADRREPSKAGGFDQGTAGCLNSPVDAHRRQSLDGAPRPT